jgi:hypothetical protein
VVDENVDHAVDEAWNSAVDEIHAQLSTDCEQHAHAQIASSIHQEIFR